MVDAYVACIARVVDAIVRVHAFFISV